VTKFNNLFFERSTIMANETAHPNMYAERVTAKLVMGGALAETLTGAGTLVLAIIGLAGFMPMTLLSIATIGLGASFLLEGGAVATRLSDVISEVTEGRVDIAELGSGLSAEFIAGIGGIALGILSLVGILPMVLTAVAAIVFGGALVVGAGVKNRLSHLTIGEEEHRLARIILREAVMASGGVQLLVGLAAIVLGILALLNIVPMELTLVAVLSAGGVVLLGGTALGARMVALFRH
jgi:hypothetical protein